MAWHVPLGYEWVDGKIQIEKKFADLVIQIFMDFDGGKSACQIARELTQRGVTNTHGRVTWTHGVIGAILENRKYLGTDEYEQLIDAELFDRVQNRREYMRAESSKGNYRPDKNIRKIFDGVVVCAKCGSKYTYRQPPCKKRNKYIPLWMCKQHEYFRRDCRCTNSVLSNEQLKDICTYAVNQFIKNSRSIKRHEEHRQKFSREFWEINRKIEQSENINSEEIVGLLFKRAEERYKTLEVRDESIQTAIMKSAIENQKEIEEFDERLYRNLIRKIIVCPDNAVEVVFHNKDSLKISYQ